MKYLGIIIVFIFLNQPLAAQKAGSPGSELPGFFRFEIISALDRLAIDLPEILAVFRQLDTDPLLMLSVVFPEMVRYSLLRDIIETAGLKVLYINLGKEYADFSIGPFQMKPSFAEQVEVGLENIICPDDSLKILKKILGNYDGLSVYKLRGQRVERLENILWQVRYLCAFYRIIEQRDAFINISDNADRIRYLSAVYNGGLNVSEEFVLMLYGKRWFPYGSGDPSSFMNYQDIALYAFEIELPLLFKLD
jgi:hypothetical protein